MKYIALLALQLRSVIVGEKLPFLLIVIPKYLYSLVFSNILLPIKIDVFLHGYF